MARTPPPHANFHDEPSIIIDPSLYLPERRGLLQIVCDTFLDVTRSVLVLSLAAVTVFSVVHVIRCRSLSAQAPAAAPFLLQIAAPGQAEVQLTAPAPAGPGLLERDLAEAITERIALDDGLSVRRAPLPAPARVRTASSPCAVVIDVRTGQRLLALKRFDEAERAFLDALALRTGQPAALAGLARVRLARGDLEQARTLAERAVDGAPYQASYHVTLGDVLRLAGETSAADAQYEFASRLSPKPALAARGPLPPNPF